MAKAYEQVWKSITGMPAESLKDKRYHFGKIDSSGNLAVAGNGEKVVGVIYEPNEVGQPTQVVVAGIAFITLGGTVAAGAEVQSDANGAAITREPGDIVEGDFVEGGRSAGVCLVGGTEGDIGCILLNG